MSHPAKFSDVILERAVAMLDSRPDVPRYATVLDPMAGTGKGVDFLRAHEYEAVGIDLEPVDAWGDAIASKHVGVGNALDLDFDDDSFDVVFTSPTYGNRFADAHRLSDKDWLAPGLKQREAPYPRVSYTHAIQWATGERDRQLDPSNSGAMQWGVAYRELHRAAWAEARRVLKPGGLFLLNCSDHYRDRLPQGVTAWHLKVLGELGFEWVDATPVPTPRMGRGANGKSRCEVEWLHLAKKIDTGAQAVMVTGR